MRLLLISLACLLAGCAGTRPDSSAGGADVTPPPAAESPEDESGNYLIQEAETMSPDGRTAYALSIDTPELPERLISDLVARYGRPSEVLGSRNTWRGAEVEGVEGPVTYVITFNNVSEGDRTYFKTFVQASSASGADLLVPGSASRAAIESYFRSHLRPVQEGP